MCVIHYGSWQNFGSSGYSTTSSWDSFEWVQFLQSSLEVISICFSYSSIPCFSLTCKIKFEFFLDVKSQCVHLNMDCCLGEPGFLLILSSHSLVNDKTFLRKCHFLESQSFLFWIQFFAITYSTMNMYRFFDHPWWMCEKYSHFRYCFWFRKIMFL